MSEAVVDTDSFVVLYVVENGGQYHVAAAQWDMLDAAHGNWVERRIDKQLCLTARNGSEIRIAASRISDMSLSTPETRAKSRELDAEMKAEGGYEEDG